MFAALHLTTDARTTLTISPRPVGILPGSLAGVAPVRGAACKNMNWQEYFTYDEETGNLVWKERAAHLYKTEGACRQANKRTAGKTVASKDRDGYVVARVHKRHFYAHRIIWEMHNGPIPKGMEIDHKDRSKANNLLSNLRLATRSQNIRNSTKRISKRGGVGFERSTGRYFATLKEFGERHRLGVFDDPKDAAEAYREASLRIHGDFSPFKD